MPDLYAGAPGLLLTEDAVTRSPYMNDCNAFGGCRSMNLRQRTASSLVTAPRALTDNRRLRPRSRQRKFSGRSSASAVIGRLLLEGQQQCVLLPLINTPAINSGWPMRATAYRKSLLTLLPVADLRAVAVCLVQFRGAFTFVMVGLSNLGRTGASGQSDRYRSVQM